jgi:hypothetical protein
LFYSGDLIYDLQLSESEENDSHTIQELKRRQASFLVVEPLDEYKCRHLLELYSQTSSMSRRSSLPPVLSSQVKEMIISSLGSSSPLYVRLLINGVELTQQQFFFIQHKKKKKKKKKTTFSSSS